METVNNILLMVLCLCIMFFTYAIPKIIDYYRRKDLHKKVQSCFYDAHSEGWYPHDKLFSDNYLSCCARHFLYNHFFKAQHEAGIDEKYKVVKEENDDAIDIIKTFQQRFLREYLLNKFSVKHSSKFIDSTEYLIGLFGEFLCTNQYERDFNGHPMFVKEEGSDELKYRLTPYSRVFLKMSYVAQLYCNNKRGALFAECSLENTKEFIDNDYIIR